MMKDVALMMRKLLMELLSGDDWRCQILVERAHGLAFPLGYANPLHVAARLQTF